MNKLHFSSAYTQIDINMSNASAKCGFMGLTVLTQCFDDCPPRFSNVSTVRIHCHQTNGHTLSGSSRCVCCSDSERAVEQPMQNKIRKISAATLRLLGLFSLRSFNLLSRILYRTILYSHTNVFYQFKTKLHVASATNTFINTEMRNSREKLNWT